MPLDGKIENFIQTRPDLSKPTPEALIWVLENWSESPVADMKFEFRTPTPHKRLFGLLCDSAGCAMGTAQCLWGYGSSGATFGTHALRIRSGEIYLKGQFDKRVTAKVVAGRMRDALAGRPIRYLVENDRA